ncbi:hypothetical protein [Klebsiella quasipneumoniae]|uniref:hypothetical protein n=1 Tax=Klebsiella quasipneumoniae TaxID=1463165 RepID=UPI0007CBC563|nr:hypothetical protein [Klebsiella quasipneumoniae]SAU77225.1 Uncharacterised protein [Klebsiella quasipneumoniae]
MNIETVNELIASLESAGELSIREQKFLKLAKAYQQLAAENVALKAFGDKLNKMYDDLNGEGVGWQGRAEVVCQQEALGKAMEEFDAIKTPSTDRIVAGIKADGVEEFAAYQRAITEEWACKEGHSSLLKVAESAEIFAKQLREGADK